MASRFLYFFNVCTEDHPVSHYQQYFEQEMGKGKTWNQVCTSLKMKMCCRTCIKENFLQDINNMNRDVFIDDTQAIPIRRNGEMILPTREVPEFPIF